MGRLRNCPFCGKDVNDEYYDVHYNDKIDKWLFSHWCNDESATDDVYLTVYGNSEQDVIDKWNGVRHGEQHPAN